MTVIFQPSDLNQHGRAILDAARQGGARIRDKDGTGLLVLPEGHVAALETSARYAAEFLAIERALPASKTGNREAIQVSPWPWLAFLDDDDFLQFLTDLRESLIAAFKTDAIEPLEQVIHEWRTTAEELADPTRRRILLEPLVADDYVAVRPPEATPTIDRAHRSDTGPSGSDA